MSSSDLPVSSSLVPRLQVLHSDVTKYNFFPALPLVRLHPGLHLCSDCDKTDIEKQTKRQNPTRLRKSECEQVADQSISVQSAVINKAFGPNLCLNMQLIDSSL